MHNIANRMSPLKKPSVAQPDLTGDRAVALKAIKDETIELDKSFRDKHKTQKAAH